MRSRLEVALEARRIATLCDGPLRLADDVHYLAPALTEARARIDQTSDIVVTSSRAVESVFGSPDVRRVFVAVDCGCEEPLVGLARANGLSRWASSPLECLRAVARNRELLSAEFWRRVFAWIETDEQLREAVICGEMLASALLPAHAGARILLVCERSDSRETSGSAAGSTPPLGVTDGLNPHRLLAAQGLDPAFVGAQIAQVLRDEPRAAVIAWFVATTVRSPALDAFVGSLFPSDVRRDFAEWTRIDRLNTNVTHIAWTWYRRLIPHDVLTYRGLDLGYTLEVDSVKELIGALNVGAAPRTS